MARSPHDGPPIQSRSLVLGGAALFAAATALWVARRARRAERDHPPIGHFADVDGIPVHHVDVGEGPAVVLLHGNTVLLQDFVASGLLDALARHHRVVAFDRPGFGFTPRPRDRPWTPAAQAALIGRAMSRLGIDHAVVVGHSWGTLVALELALDAPGRVDGLVLAGGYYYPTVRADAALMAPAALPVIGDALRYTVAPIAGRLSLKSQVKAMFSPQPVPEAFFEAQQRELLLRPSQLGANAEDAAYMVPAAASLSRRYGELRVPVHLLAGRSDRVVDPEAHSMRLHRELPGSELELVPDAGHMVHYAAPLRVLEAVDAMTGRDQTADRDRIVSPPDGVDDRPGVVMTTEAVLTPEQLASAGDRDGDAPVGTRADANPG
jgi:pimeloyl-ACP methyl ester carboxylesterase